MGVFVCTRCGSVFEDQTGAGLTLYAISQTKSRLSREMQMQVGIACRRPRDNPAVFRPPVRRGYHFTFFNVARTKKLPRWLSETTNKFYVPAVRFKLVCVDSFVVNLSMQRLCSYVHVFRTAFRFHCSDAGWWSVEAGMTLSLLYSPCPFSRASFLGCIFCATGNTSSTILLCHMSDGVVTLLLLCQPNMSPERQCIAFCLSQSLLFEKQI